MRRERRHESNVLILDPERGWGLTYRANPPGEPYRFHGRQVHLCTLDDGQLKPVELPAKTAGTLPEDLYQARFWPEVQELFGVVKTTWEKLEAGLWIPALGILALLSFLMFSELLG